jgi:hypothetical protein
MLRRGHCQDEAVTSRSSGSRVFTHECSQLSIWRSTVLSEMAGKTSFKLALPDSKQY